MADLSGITAVRPTENTRTELVKYGATISLGNTLYLDASDNEYKLADADLSEAAAKSVAIAMTPGVDGGYGLVAKDGSIILVGATMTAGESYLVSDTAGGIRPNADKNSGDYITEIGRAATTTQLDLSIEATGIQI